MAGGWDKVNYSKTPEERREAAAAAGRASGEVRRRKKTWRESVEMLMQGRLDDEHAQAIIEQFHLDDKTPEDMTQQDKVLAAIADKAQRGDRDCAAFLRDTAGQAPAQMVKVGNLDGPFETLDLASLSDEDLRKLAERERPD